MKNSILFTLGFLCLLLISCTAEKPADTAADAAAAEPAAKPPAEFADAKYADMVKKGMDSFSSGDIAAWMDGFADNAVYAWNNGDSLAGKAAISEYWTKRRGQDITAISFKNGIYLPIQVNTPQSVEAPGVWVLSWYETTATYKSGKSMTQWIHSDTHFNADGKIDRVISYLDRAPINAAMAK